MSRCSRSPVAVLFALLIVTGPAGADSKQPPTLDTVVVTSTREAQHKRDLPESVSVLDDMTIQDVAPAHPAELLNRVPGVHVNNLGGEGHMTAIRQPITTGGVYLFLEDGIPTRPTGYFNHNGLYEVNIPQAGGVEVTRGPGSALFGSDAIGGLINTLTAPPPASGSEFKADIETGSHGWKRGLFSAGVGNGEGDGAIVSINVTDSDGYPRDGDYQRESATLRWDVARAAGQQVKTILAWNQINQSGVSGLREDDYQDHPQRNYYQGDIGRREVYAVRLSSEWAFDLGAQDTLTLTPFFRDNQMDLMPSWMLDFDPQYYTTEFQAYGLLTKYRRTLPQIDGQLIAGMDVDVTPSRYTEDRIAVTRDGRYYTGFTYTGRTNYDFDATQDAVSPYAQLDWQLLSKLRASLGVRYDWFKVDYTDNLAASVAETGPIQAGRPTFVHYRPDDQNIEYDQFSPKAGLIFALSEQQDLYVNFRHGFRVPTAGQLFRAGSNVNSVELEPVRSDSVEVGTRGTLWQWFNYELALYQMDIRDDIVSYIEDGIRYASNAGATRHRGVEMGLGGDVSEQWGFNLAWAWSDHEYRDFSYICSPPACVPTTTRNYSGNDMARAPEYTGNITVHYLPALLQGLRIEVQREQIGRYFLDETNTESYSGHTLYHLRGRYWLTDQLELYARVENLTDERYSTNTSKNTSGVVEYRPGLPLGGYLGVRYAM